MMSVQNRCETSMSRTLSTIWLMPRGAWERSGAEGTDASLFGMVPPLLGASRVPAGHRTPDGDGATIVRHSPPVLAAPRGQASSGITHRGWPPAATRWMLSNPFRNREVQFSHVGPAEWGVRVTFGSENSG